MPLRKIPPLGGKLIYVKQDASYVRDLDQHNSANATALYYSLRVSFPCKDKDQETQLPWTMCLLQHMCQE